MSRIVSFYWNNIDSRIVETQRKIFAHFGYAIDQRERTGMDHGDFLDSLMQELDEDEVVLIVDIDCFPLNQKIVQRAFAAARDGRLLGCAQSSNHINPDRLFIAPSFMSISRRTWEHIGCPSFKSDAQNDIAQRLSDIAAAKGVTLEFLYPWGSIVPQWRLADIALYGTGTFFRDGVFHLYESRNTAFSYILFDVANAVLNGRQIDYLDLMSKASQIRFEKRKRSFIEKWRRSYIKRKERLLWAGKKISAKISSLFGKRSGASNPGS